MLNVQGLGQGQAVSTLVADGDRGTRETIRYARQLVAEGLRDPVAHELALHFCKVYGAAPYDEMAELEAVFDGVHDNFEYRKHVVGAQSLQPVSGMLRTGAGDCAELNLILLPVLLGTIGYPTRAVSIKADPTRPREFSHVYIEAQTTDGEWVPMDVARQDTAFGVEPPYYWGREEFDLTPESGGRMNGYGTRRRGLGAKTNVIFKRRSAMPRRGLGQADGDGDGGGLEDWAPEITTAIQATPAILTGVAQVVKASNTPGIAYSGVGLPTAGTAGTPGVSVTGSSTPLLVLLLIAAAAAFALGGRG